MFLKKNPDNKPELVQASRQEIEQMKKESEKISYEELHFLFDMLLKGEKEMALCHDSQLVLEVLLLRFCSAPRLESIVPLAFAEQGRQREKLKEEQGKKPKEWLKEEQGKKPKEWLKEEQGKKPKEWLKEEQGKKPKEWLKEEQGKKPKEWLKEEQGKKPKEWLKEEQKTVLPKDNPTLFSKKSNTQKEISFQKDSKKIHSNPSVEKKKINSEDFDKRFDFIEFLRKKDQTLTALVENLTLKRKSKNHFYFSVPETFSYLKNKVTEPGFQKILEDQLREFLNSREKVKIEILDGKNKDLSLREERKIIEEDKFLSQVQENSFVNEVKDLFDGEIKSVTKDSK